MADILGYPDGIYQYIFNTALFLHPTHIFASFYYGMNICGLIGTTLYATSLNYWRYPLLNNIRRTMDMVVAKLSVGYHFYLSLYTTNRLITALPIAIGSGFYFFSIYLEKKKYVKTAACCHCLLHILVSIGATLTYRDYYLQNKSLLP